MESDEEANICFPLPSRGCCAGFQLFAFDFSCRFIVSTREARAEIKSEKIQSHVIEAFVGFYYSPSL
jgi:hypothetical protein